MRTDSVKFWSLTASVGAHLVLFIVLGLWKLSEGSETGAARPAPSAIIASVSKQSVAASITPKPKVRDFSGERGSGGDEGGSILNTLFTSGLSDQPQDKTVIVRPAGSAMSHLPQAGAVSHTVEFFGSSTDQRKICYVVDCSGSMQGVFSRVRAKLKESISDLRPNQYFYVIFFGGDRFFESGQGRLVRATDKARTAACEFIDSVRPAGQTNAAAALARAMEIRDDAGDKPSVIYFLTDGFELDPQQANAFSRNIAAMVRKESSSTKINAIGFWPQTGDRAMLESIAASSGGEAVFVTEDK